MTKATELAIEDLAVLGASKSCVHWLDKPSARSIQYLDLTQLPKRSDPDRRTVAPVAVVEFEGQPLLYIVDNRSLAGRANIDPKETRHLLRILACRGDPAYLAILEFGQVILHPISLKKTGRLEGVSWNFDSMGYRSLVQDLVAGAVPGLDQRDVRRSAVHDLLFRLLAEATDQLLDLDALRQRHDDVLALVGRAFFARFLVDRNLITPQTFSGLKVRPEECFARPRSAAAVCRWLDREFNGELLPFADGKYNAFFDSLGKSGKEICGVLSHIMYRAPGGQLTFDSQWADLDFAHVPVGLLSEVYERFAHRHLGARAAKESMHYTPRHIAEFMMEEAFAGVEPERRYRARLLDPAAGGGVFLTLGLRKLVAENWARNNRRPSRQAIRKILYEQIRGFDINPSALKLAALGLYLTAIELDPNPSRAEDLAFRPLFAFAADTTVNTVLTCARLPGELDTDPYVMGSLGSAICDRHFGRYDIVISNPPWTSLTSAGGAGKVTKQFSGVVRQVAHRRAESNNQHPGLLEVANSYNNPDGVPDLPFVWKATEWAKNSGIIALALHARLLFKQSAPGDDAREALFTGVRVTGILNGSAVRTTKVWPKISAPWCLLFARNEVPQDHQVFHYFSIELEHKLNNQGRIRIDHKNAQPIQFSVLREKSYLLKTLFRGSALDAAVMDHLFSLSTVPLAKYMESRGLRSGEGYQVHERSKKPSDSSQMIGMLDLNREWAPRYSVNPQTVSRRFERSILHRPRDIAIYRGPLMIIPVSLPEDPDQGRGLIGTTDVAYNESFTGYSAHGFKMGDPEDLARYLHVLTYSKLFLYVMLMNSAQFGVERDSVQKEDVDAFPIIPFEDLPSEVVEACRALSKAVEAERAPWGEIDGLVFGIYEVSSRFQKIILDTLSVALPYSGSVERGQRPPTEREIEKFCLELESHLRPLFENAGVDIAVTGPTETGGSWSFIDIVYGTKYSPSQDTHWAHKLADDQGASAIFVLSPPNHLGVGILNEYRYWTPSRSHLCALTIVRDFSDQMVADGRLVE